jgi:hypothetical protein
MSIPLHFNGPFGWAPDGTVPCVFDSPLGSKPGIYFWAVPTTDGELVYYVGETGRDFATRLTEHLRDQLSGIYCIYEPSKFSEGIKHLLWKGILGRSRESHLTEFVRRYVTLAPELDRYVRLMHFYLAPCECEGRLRLRIEAALADHFREAEGVVGDFQDQGIRYERSLPGDPEELVSCTSDTVIRGLPSVLSVKHSQKLLPNTSP